MTDHSSPENAQPLTNVERAKAIAAEANKCCQRSDGYAEDIEALALKHINDAIAQADLIRVQQTASEAPRFYIVNQHIGWLKQYILGMDEKNWRDMQLRAERQLESLSEEIDKEEAALGTRP